MHTSIAGFRGRVNHRAAAATARSPGSVSAAPACGPRAPGCELADAGPDLADGAAGAMLYGLLVLLVAVLA